VEEKEEVNVVIAISFYFDLLKPKSIFWSGVGVPRSFLIFHNVMLAKGDA